MATVREITQATVAIGSMFGTFILVGMGQLPAETAILFMGGLLSGLGIGYVNGNKAATKKAE